ncbi:MAG: glycosyltransferase family 4 protein [Chloroflexota bacterium]|nr:glycosyltransferase family 4 protein [Chloroflexota bacterium]
MKVAHITTIDMSLRYLLFNQLRSIQHAGYQVVGISSPGPDVPVIEAAGIRHIPIPMTRNVTPLADLVSLWRLYWIMRRERFTIVHAHTPKAELLGQVAARIAGVPIVVDTFRGIYFRNDMHPLWRRLFIAMSKIAARCAAVVLSQSSANIQMAIREGICPPEKIKYLGNGIDVQQFDRSALDPEMLERKRRDLDLPSSVSVIGFVGRLVAEKGIWELLQAAYTILQQIPTARFLIIGPIDYDKPDALTPDIARDYNITDACIFTGMRQDMPELYALMDVFVFPSHRESFPRSPMEASAMGVPCVATDIPGCREAVEHELNGLMVPPGDVQALADAIVELLTDQEKARRMGEEGRRMALERFDEQLIFEKVKLEYARLLQAKGLTLPQQTEMTSKETLS